jgi:hypothetical protein
MELNKENNNNLNDWFCFLPGYPGKYTRQQSILLSAYMLLLLNTFVMFYLSVSHLYGIQALTIQWWLILSGIGLTLCCCLTSYYFIMMAWNKKGVDDPRFASMLLDFPRFWISAASVIWYNTMCVQILFIWLYTKDHQDYLTLLNQGLKLYGSYGFIETRLVAFLTNCQYTFTYIFSLFIIEYLIYPNKKKIKTWMQNRNSMNNKQ